MASFRKRGSKWHVQVRRNGQASRTKSFKHKADAEAWARKTERAIDTGELGVGSDLLRDTLVMDLMVRYEVEVLPKKRSACVEVYMVRRYQNHRIGSLQLDQFRARNVADYRDERMKIVSSTAVHRELSVLRHCIEVARKDWGYPIKVNPVTQITMPPLSKPRTRRVSGEELSALMQSCTHELLPHIVTIAIETGMRRGEIVAMKWEDINWEMKTLLIPVTKNGHPRTIPLTPQAIETIQALPRDEDRVIPMTGNAVRLAWERLKKKAGIEDLRFHDLRHEAISRFFELGLSVPEVALISGHRDPRMLFRYTHLRAETVAEKLHRAAL